MALGPSPRASITKVVGRWAQVLGLALTGGGRCRRRRNPLPRLTVLRCEVPRSRRSPVGRRLVLVGQVGWVVSFGGCSVEVGHA
jgi:hypothetical protein